MSKEKLEALAAALLLNGMIFYALIGAWFL